MNMNLFRFGKFHEFIDLIEDGRSYASVLILGPFRKVKSKKWLSWATLLIWIAIFFPCHVEAFTFGCTQIRPKFDYSFFMSRQCVNKNIVNTSFSNIFREESVFKQSDFRRKRSPKRRGCIVEILPFPNLDSNEIAQAGTKKSANDRCNRSDCGSIHKPDPFLWWNDGNNIKGWGLVGYFFFLVILAVITALVFSASVLKIEFLNEIRHYLYDYLRGK
jgi:hypothetical protein